MKILFLINALEHGGAARVTVTISNELASRGYIMYIMANTVYQQVNYRVNDNVTLVPLFTEKFYNISRLIRKFYFYYNIRYNLKKIRPDVIIGMMPKNYLLAKLFSLGLSIPVIASEHTSFKRMDI